MTKKQSEKKAKSPVNNAEIPTPGPGRKKGSKNKFTNLKEAFLQAFEQTGGVLGLVEWITKNARNRGDFYKMITKMLPANVDVATKGDITIVISDKFLPKDGNNSK